MANSVSRTTERPHPLDMVDSTSADVENLGHICGASSEKTKDPVILPGNALPRLLVVTSSQLFFLR